MDKKNDSNNLESIKNQFKITKECPLCTKNYGQDVMKLLHRDEEAVLYHIRCPHCQNALAIIVGLTSFGMGLVALVTDLTAEDAKKYFYKEAISEDKMLEIYSLINNQNYNFNQFFK